MVMDGHGFFPQEMQKKNAFSVEAKLIDACQDACPEHHSRLGRFAADAIGFHRFLIDLYRSIISPKLVGVRDFYGWLDVGIGVGGSCQRQRSRGELLYTEMACSLSHLRAIDQALAGQPSSAQQGSFQMLWHGSHCDTRMPYAHVRAFTHVFEYACIVTHTSIGRCSYAFLCVCVRVCMLVICGVNACI